MPLVEVVGNTDKLAPEQIAATCVKVGVVGAFTVTVVPVEVAVSPTAFVTSTVYTPDCVAVYVFEVCPMIAEPFNNHLYVVAAPAVRTTEPGAQKVTGPEAVTVAIGMATPVNVDVDAAVIDTPLIVTSTL
jgi:hypothetical protein